VLRVKEHAPTFFFFHCLTLGPTFESLGFQSSSFKPKGNFVKKGAPLKGSQPKGDINGKPKGACYNCNKVGHYSKDFSKPKLGNEGSKVIAAIANLVQGEYSRLIILKGKVFK
jgi:hypothetical protein